MTEQDLLVATIEAMPRLERQVVTMRKIYGLTEEQIRQRLGITRQELEDAMTSAIRKIEEALGAQHE